MKSELKMNVMAFLKREGLTARESGSDIAINRDSMCQSRFSNDGLPEMDAYPAVLWALKSEFGEGIQFFWYGKTDEDLFLDVIGGWGSED